MTPIIFDGYRESQLREIELQQKTVRLISRGIQPTIAAILFREDKGSVLYTNLKIEAAKRIGIEYRVYEFSMTDAVEKIVTQIQQLNNDNCVTGIIAQKPWRHTWRQINQSNSIEQNHFANQNQNQNDNNSNLQNTVVMQHVANANLNHAVVTENNVNENLNLNHPVAVQHNVNDNSNVTTTKLSFSQWWHSLTVEIDERKDVDGLSPSTLELIKSGQWQQHQRVLPATCQAVLSILERYTNLFSTNSLVEQGRAKIAIIGKSDLMGTPLYWVLKHRRCDAMLLGKKEMEQGIAEKNYLHGFNVIISATGVHKLITSELVDELSTIIDVGEPRGDVDFGSVMPKTSFISPVPGGVGPMTVVSLMANCLDLAAFHSNE